MQPARPAIARSLVALILAGSFFVGAASCFSTKSYAGTSEVKSIAGGEVISLSCPTASFCLGVTQGSEYIVFNGRQWSAPKAITHLDVGEMSASCSSSQYCVAVAANDSYMFVFNGNTWSQEGTSADFGSVTCTHDEFCMGDSSWIVRGRAMSYINGPLESYPPVDCVTPQFCLDLVQVNQKNYQTYIFNGHEWTGSRAYIPATTSTADVFSCGSVRHCIAISSQIVRNTKTVAVTYELNGSTWSALRTNNEVLTANESAGYSLSCVTANFCAALEDPGASYDPHHGQLMTFNGSDWSDPLTIDPGYNFNAVSCATSRFCVAVDGNTSNVSAHAFEFNGKGWIPMQ